jgi:hypothetical protein
VRAGDESDPAGEAGQQEGVNQQDGSRVVQETETFLNEHQERERAESAS